MKEDIFQPTDKELEVASKMIKKSIKNTKLRSLDDEREFMERLLVQRLNFLILVFPIFLTAGIQVNNSIGSAIVFFVGAFFCWMLSLIIYRAHIKHHWVMRLFYKMPDNKYYYEKDSGQNPHPVKFINDAMDFGKRICVNKGSVSRIVGKWIPMFTWLVLLIFGLFKLLICFIPGIKDLVESFCVGF